MFSDVKVYCYQTIKEFVESDFDLSRLSLAFTQKRADQPNPKLRKKWVLKKDGQTDQWANGSKVILNQVPSLHTGHLSCPLRGQCVAQRCQIQTQNQWLQSSLVTMYLFIYSLLTILCPKFANFSTVGLIKLFFFFYTSI